MEPGKTYSVEVIGDSLHNGITERNITLPTNGILSDAIFTQTEEILNKIPKYTHLRMGLSIEGVGEKHDDIVGIKGAFEKVPLIAAINKADLASKEEIENAKNSVKEIGINEIILCGEGIGDEALKERIIGEVQRKLLCHIT